MTSHCGSPITRWPQCEDGISRSLCSLTYVSGTAVKLVKQLGRGTLLAKVDIQSAYWMLPIQPDHWWLLGMYWEGSVFVDTALPFGLRSAPKIFKAVANALKWIVKREGVRSVIHYLDDFLLAGPLGSLQCTRDLNTILSSFSHLGVTVATKKLEGLPDLFWHHCTTTSPPTGQAGGAEGTCLNLEGKALMHK